MTAPARDAVRVHYAQLAQDYDRRANKACKRAYMDLVRSRLAGMQRVLELGAGSDPIASVIGAPLTVACDLSLPMLGLASAARRVVADGVTPPFRAESFDAIFSINVLEHVPNPAGFARACATLLKPGGLFLAVTPNGDVAWLLDMLERLRLKLPEGPHRFLRHRELIALADAEFEVIEHRRWLAFPAGPSALVRFVDRLGPRGGWGLFQYVLLRRR
jgi:2-polyprenyl-3-methyl-5-hydroxy-6-metoxy-1,4-benzoquinol methylase